MYDKTKIGSNEKCDLCKKIGKDKLAGPISFFHIGSNFGNDTYKIVFVGKNTFYNKEDFEKEKKKGNVADVTETGRHSIKGEGENCINSPYWYYLRDIIVNLYNNIDKGIKKVAITNLIKCNTGGPRDITPEEIRRNCINFGVFENEIKILKPTHIIFFTGRDYDDYIESFDFGFKHDKIKDKGKQTKIKNNKKIIWWEREFCNNKGRIKLKTLRTYHPGYLQRRGCNAFSAEEIVRWIKNNSNG